MPFAKRGKLVEYMLASGKKYLVKYIKEFNGKGGKEL